MRTTNNMLINNMMFYMKSNLERVSKYQTQLATGKKITIPSDDPIVAARALRFRTDVSQVIQFQSNAKDANSWMDMTEDALGKMGNILQTIYNKAVEAANTGTQGFDERNSIRQEIMQLKDQIIHLANSSYAGRYIFSGYSTDSKLLNDDGTYAVSVSSRETAVITGALVNMPVTIDGTNNTFDISLTGGGYTTITLPPKTYSSLDELAADIQNAITAADPDNLGGIRVKNNDGRLEFSLANTVDSNGNYRQIYLRKGTNDLLKAVNIKTDVITGIVISKSEDINYQVGIGDLLNVNVLGSEVFGSGVKGDMGELILKLNNFIDSLAYTDDRSYIYGQPLKADSLNPLTFTGNEEFSITIDGNTYDHIKLSAKTYDGDAAANQTLDDLALDIQTQINNAIGADGYSVTVKNDNGRIVICEDSGKQITLTEGAAGVDALRKLNIYTNTDKKVTSFTGEEGLQNAIGDMQNLHNKILSIQADIGARTNRAELTLNRLQTDELNFTELMSNNENVDMAEAIINLMNEYNVYNASLAGGARVIMTSLVDFLK
ncbi:flagellar hook-associated protein FlgL [Clostridium thermosuccinogenes]|uniref:flagellar hook-associated protein FlgL n=1 Tax=Clostridium thermosuccinogenes TaxID=84032 RepID=UPI00137A5972|nr:flagellar hook-associated protein FlgL [Pseudoclostridium thermosuccinogenes]